MDAPRFRDWTTPHGTALIAVLLVCLLALLTLPACGRAAGAGAIPAAAAVPAGSARPVAVDPPAAAAALAAIAVHEATDAVAEAATETRLAIADPIDDVQRAAANATAPAVVAMRETVQAMLPSPAPRGAVEPVSSPVSPAAVALIVRHEIISPAYYAKALQGFACPGDRSGPTAGIGSDLGVQTRATIRDVWSIHPGVERMTTASGKVGFGPCRAWRTAHKDIRTPLPLAQEVFASKLLPRYHRLASRAFRKTWDRLPPDAQGGLTATVFVRGASMEDAPGTQMRKEMRVIRDECDADVRCIATQHRRMCPRFAGRKDQAGLCKRLNDTADLIERSAA